MHRRESGGLTAELDRAWHGAIRDIGAQMGDWARNAYLDNLRPVSLEGPILTIGATNEFARSRLEERYSRTFESVLSDQLRRAIRVKFVMLRPAASPTVEPEKGPTPAAPEVSSASGSDMLGFSSLALNPRYTFDCFVVGSSNRLAHAAAQNVANSPGRTYNPLFIYGGVGLGKTHLMQAIGHHALQANPGIRVVYISGETFLNHVVTAIRDGRTDAFRQAYRTVDLWLVHDIQFIASKEQSRTEAEFFHTFNALYETNKQIVISSDRTPQDLQIMDDRLRSRFEMGLLTDIRMPDEETRFAILQRKASSEQARVPDEVLKYIADMVRSSVRALEGALTRVIASASLTGSNITLETAREWLADYASRDGHVRITPRQVRDAVARHFGLKPEELAGKRRDRAVVVPRQIAMYLARELGQASTVQIGTVFGGRDHSTVLHACQKVRDMLETDTGAAQLIADITSAIRSPDSLGEGD